MRGIDSSLPIRRRTAAALLLMLAAAIWWNATPETGGAAENPVVAPGSVRIGGVPHVRQRPDFCGEACAVMWFRKLGRPFTQDDVFEASGCDPALGRGAVTRELAVGLRALGFDTGPVRTRVPPKRAAVEAEWRALHADLAKGIPSIVCMRTARPPRGSEHFRLVLGYDAGKDEVVYHDPAIDGAAYRRMDRSEFIDLWPLRHRADRWTVVRFRLADGGIAARPIRDPNARHSAADFAQHVRKLKEKLPGEGFTVVVERPFVVIGDEAGSVVRGRARGTVRWASDLLKEGFFAKDPIHILDVWLFKGKRSYEENAVKLFRRRPTTIYGYYSSHHRALVMNIATGGGTLVHEIVHPFVEANFPECPPWFNEGLGSLFEQCRKTDGKIVGLTNWRLAGLQSAIRADRVSSLEELTAMGEDEFYGPGRGVHYAQARYLLYYLQEKGLLRSYYRRFHAAREKDPTGYTTLRAVLGENDMPAFRKRWHDWVLKLSFTR